MIKSQNDIKDTTESFVLSATMEFQYHVQLHTQLISNQNKNKTQKSPGKHCITCLN